MASHYFRRMVPFGTLYRQTSAINAVPVPTKPIPAGGGSLAVVWGWGGSPGLIKRRYPPDGGHIGRCPAGSVFQAAGGHLFGSGAEWPDGCVGSVPAGFLGFFDHVSQRRM